MVAALNAIERQFENVLAFHQAMGRGAMRYSKNKAETDKHQEQLATQFQEILQCLLPASNDSTIQGAAKRLLNMAVDLKEVMTEERVLFELLWVDGGEDFEEQSMEVEWGQSSSVLLCTFPGLVVTKAVDNEVTANKMVMVKAKVATSERV